jgi:soluble lytic murein transglycosylase-like protein
MGVRADCWDQAEATYGVSADLLYAIARAESDLNPRAVNKSHVQRTGSYDIGLMQINSGHLPTLRNLGIRESDLWVPCTSVMVGAWILAQLFQKHGVTWDAVGAYNAACSQLRGAACTSARSKYAWRVYRRLPQRTGVSAAVTGVASPAQSSSPTPVVRADQSAPHFILSARVTP